MTDETVAFTLSQRDPARRRAAFWVSGIGLFTVWNAGVAAGALAAARWATPPATAWTRPFPPSWPPW